MIDVPPRSKDHDGEVAVRVFRLVAVAAAGIALTGCSGAAAPARPATAAPSGRHSRSGAPGRTSGRLVTVSIPGGVSGFRPRRAYVYLPPAAVRNPHVRLPVLELLHGNPGNPSDWQVGGHVRGTLDAFAAAHDGQAPVVVMPDINGAHRADSECVRAPDGGDVEQYLTEQVPTYVLAHFPVTADRRRWAIAGLSEGGMCSLVLALRHPAGFRAFGDLSGLSRPTLGRTDDEPRTLAGLFAGSLSAYEQHDALWLLAHHRYPSLSGWLFSGARDHDVLAAEARIAAAAPGAGLSVHRVVLPGGHKWSTWAAAFRRFLPWLWPLVSTGA